MEIERPASTIKAAVGDERGNAFADQTLSSLPLFSKMLSRIVRAKEGAARTYRKFHHLQIELSYRQCFHHGKDSTAQKHVIVERGEKSH